MTTPPTTPRRLHWKDFVILALAVVSIGLGALVVQDRFAGAGRDEPAEGQGEPVSVFDVVIDREARKFLDILFDRPVAREGVGEVLARPPVTLSPSVGGHWRWRSESILRFEPSGQLPMATEFTVSLIPVRLLGEGQFLSGEREYTVQTDQFRVERVEVSEETLAGARREIVLRGNIRFNYRVEPKELATRLELIDPVRGEDDPVPLELETDYPSNVVAFRAGPLPKQKDERRLRLVVGSELTPQDGNVPLAEDYVEEILVGSVDRLTVRRIQTTPGEDESTARIRFSSPVSPRVLATYLELDPEVEIKLGGGGNELVLTGPLAPGETYQLTIRAGLPAADEAVLREAYRTQLRIPNLEPSVDFASDGVFLSRRGARTLAIRTVNVEKVTVAVDRVFLNNLFNLFSYYGFSNRQETYYGNLLSASLGGRVEEREIEIDGERNRTVTTVLSVDDWVDTGGPGLYRLVAYRPNDWRAAQRWLLLTDLGVVAKRGSDGVTAWVTSSATLAPLAGARVTLHSQRNQTLASGSTDARGLWRSGELKEDDSATGAGGPYLLTVERGGDSTFLLLNEMRIDTTGLDVAGASIGSTGYSAYLYGERDLYRPGETLRGVALLRDPDLGAPPAMPLVLRHRDPLGREREKLALNSGARGLAGFELEIPEYTPTGRHNLELLVGEEVAGRYLFHVEEFVPDRIKADIDAAGGVGPGEELAYQVRAAYLFGPPAAALPFETRVRLADAEFAPAGFEEFVFRNADRKFDDREIHVEKGFLDEEGRHPVQATLPEAGEVPSSLEAIVTARVSEQGGRGVTALTRVRVHPYPYYVGLRRTQQGHAEPGTDASFEYVAVDAGGKERASGMLRAELFRDRWYSVLRRTASGSYRYESRRQAELVDTIAIGAGPSRGQFALRIPEYGSYRVTLTDTETSASSRVEFYAAGWGYAPWAQENPALVELELDHEEYRPGQSAVVLVKAPFAGKLLLTVEREGVLHTSVHDIEGNTARVEIPVREAFRPNAYVTATLIRASKGLASDAPARAFGAVPIQVDRTRNRLEVEIDAPETVRSESAVKLRVRSAPNSAVTVAAVDEGILQLISQKTPDPFDHFYRKLALGVVSSDTYALLMPEVEDRADAGGGEGAAGMAQYVRTEGIRRVTPVAFWSGILRTDSSGRAETSFAIPEFQGALRVMAVAAEGRRFGSAEHFVRVRDPIVLLPTIPRVLSFGERAEIPVTVRNDTASRAEIRVSLEIAGEAAVDGEAVRTVSLNTAGETTVYFAIRTTDREGDVGLKLTAEGNGERGRASASVPVRADLPRRVEESAGTFREAKTELGTADTGWARPGTVTRELRIGRFPLVQFSGRLDGLLRYPYGCLEQRVSTAFPLIYLEDLARQLAPQTFQPGRYGPEYLVEEGIRQVANLQLHSGGFALWTGGTTPHLWGSIYATHFLVEARRAGYGVDGPLLDNALGYLSGEASAKASYGHEELQRAVYALYVQARAERPATGTMDFIRERHADRLSSESRALLAAAYAFGGDRDAMDYLWQRVAEVGQVERQTGGNFNSTLRNRALLLLAALESRPDDAVIPELVARLAREAAQPRRWSTQESAFVLLSLGQLARRQHDRAPYSGTVFVGEREVGKFTDETVTLGGIGAQGVLRVELDPGYEPGAAFFSLLTRGIPSDDSFVPEQSGLEIERVYRNREAKDLDLREVRQGDLVVARVRLRSVSGPVENVVLQNLLPSGVEVENPRLDTTEALPWIVPSGNAPAYLDLRDDRVLMFLDLPANTWQTYYALLRAVTPGEFRVPPVQAEAMYDPSLRATGPRAVMRIGRVGGGAD